MITTEGIYRGLLVGACTLAMVGAALHIENQRQLFDLEQKLLDSERSVVHLERKMDELEIIRKDRDALLEEIAVLNATIAGHEEVDLVYAGEFYCTAYCCEKRPHICGTGSGITASGAPVTAGVSIAVSGADLPQLPFGTAVYIEGVGVRIVQDTGGMGARHLDVALQTHAEASAWSGQGNHKVFIINFK